MGALSRPNWDVMSPTWLEHLNRFQSGHKNDLRTLINYRNAILDRIEHRTSNVADPAEWHCRWYNTEFFDFARPIVMAKSVTTDSAESVFNKLALEYCTSLEAKFDHQDIIATMIDNDINGQVVLLIKNTPQARLIAGIWSIKTEPLVTHIPPNLLRGLG